MGFGTCTKQDCTVATTGKCLELHADPVSCPHFTSECRRSRPLRATVVLPTANVARRFLPGTELGLKDALGITRSRYAHLVGILGPIDAGKTCFLSALYLLACQAGLLPRFRFAGSLTLPGFELCARRLRMWEHGHLPDQLADHTMHADPRNPGLLHLALRDEQLPDRRIELLLTDLPGEWTSELIKRSQAADRFGFLKRADGVVLAVDGPKLAAAESRHSEVMNLCHLIDRLANAVGLDRRTPLVLAVFKADEVSLTIPDDAAKVVRHAHKQGFTLQPIAVASFSRNPQEVANGHGVRGVVEAIIDHRAESNGAVAQGVLPNPSRSFGSSVVRLK